MYLIQNHQPLLILVLAGGQLKTGRGELGVLTLAHSCVRRTWDAQTGTLVRTENVGCSHWHTRAYGERGVLTLAHSFVRRMWGAHTGTLVRMENVGYPLWRTRACVRELHTFIYYQLKRNKKYVVQST